MHVDLILGYKGFLSSYFYNFLKNRNKKIFLCGRKKLNIKKYYQINSFSKKSLNLLLKKIKPTRIWNFVGKYKNNNIKIFNSNYIFTKNLLDTKYNIKYKPKILLIGSAAEYGVYKEKFSENDNLRPVNIYGLSKSLQSLYAKFHYLKFNSKVIVVRLFNIVAEQMPKKLFLGKILNDLKKQNTIKIVNYDSKRDYIDVNKMSPAIFKILNKGKYGEVYNFGSGKPTKNIDILTYYLKKKKINKKKIIKIKSLKKINIYADIKKFNKL
jgi:nucleoside-diphosphate-sugar epimerase